MPPFKQRTLLDVSAWSDVFCNAAFITLGKMVSYPICWVTTGCKVASARHGPAADSYQSWRVRADTLHLAKRYVHARRRL